MKNELSTKIEKLDLEFILNNFLNPKLWRKRWQIFAWDGVVVNLTINSIDVEYQKVNLRINVDLGKNLRERKIYIFSSVDSTIVSIPYKKEHRNIELFEDQIFKSMIRGFGYVEDRIIRSLDDYTKAKESQREFVRSLEKIAEEFLDEQNVTHKAIREAYIDQYIEESNIPDFEAEVMNIYRETFVGKILVMSSLFFDNKKGKEKYSRYIKQNNLKLGALRKEIKQLKELIITEEFEEEQRDKLMPILDLNNQ